MCPIAILSVCLSVGTIAIAYSMGEIIKSFCVCQSVSVSVCGHSTVAFLDRFSPKLAHT